MMENGEWRGLHPDPVSYAYNMCTVVYQSVPSKDVYYSRTYLGCTRNIYQYVLAKDVPYPCCEGNVEVRVTSYYGRMQNGRSH